jgi:AcrR family transcriptional regulator
VGLTTRALGHRLGVDPTALYRHFRNKDELLTAMADSIVGESGPPVGADGDTSRAVSSAAPASPSGGCCSPTRR